MITDARRLLAMALSLPMGALHRGFHGLATGQHAIVEVEVSAKKSTLARQKLLLGLERLVDDDRVEAVVFYVEEAPGGRAAIHDLRVAMKRLSEAGKSTYAYLETVTNGTMWVAAAAERVFMVPTGTVNLVGVGAELVFLGGALEKLGISFDVEAAGAYKSAGEMFTRTFASPANLEATEGLIGDLQELLAGDLCADRHLSPQELEEVFAKAPLNPEEAVVHGLVDRLLYRDQLDTWLKEHHGERAKRVEIDAWAKRAARQDRIESWGSADKSIAVLHLDGSIVMDDTSRKVCIRAKHVVPLLEALRKDDDVGAVVLHINSPGGGVLSSDLIWRAVEHLREVKPVIASYEDVSASGGVYLSAPATEVLARPGTITGSVGVFGGKFVFGGGLRNVGITTQTVQRAPNATVFSMNARFTDAQRLRFREQLERWYEGFVHRVAVGRRIPEEGIEPHCRGRVWTGRMAVERGLVDRIGTLADAVERARVLAGLPMSSRRFEVPGQPDSFIRRLMERLGLQIPSFLGARGSMVERLFERMMGASMAERVDFLLEHEGQVLALLPFEIREDSTF